MQKIFFSRLFFLCFGVIFFFYGCTNNTSNQDKHEQVVSKSSEQIMNKKQLRHTVLFKFKETATPEDIKKVEDAFSALPGKIPEIKSYEWGINNSPEGLNKGFTHCFFLTFDSEEGRAAYLPHPDHKAFGDLLGPFIDDVCVVDYWSNN